MRRATKSESQLPLIIFKFTTKKIFWYEYTLIDNTQY